MQCIYCGNKTQVTNSRPQKRLNRTWRRRQCVNCGAIFTTEEAVDYSGSIAVRQPQGSFKPFSRDKLYASIYKALGHRQTAVEDASALSATIIAMLITSASDATLEPATIVAVTYETLARFDRAAAVQYQAYHQY